MSVLIMLGDIWKHWNIQGVLADDLIRAVLIIEGKAVEPKAGRWHCGFEKAGQMIQAWRLGGQMIQMNQGSSR